ncbi:hypothetical protein D3C77_437350 [compost metagenome]
MGINKKQNLIFTMMMCALMVLGMSIYNVLLIKGLSVQLLWDVIVGYVPVFIIALVLDVLVVGKIAKAIANKLIPAKKPTVKKVLLISFFMVSGMVLLMSLYGALMHVGVSNELPQAYLTAVWKNFVCALPLQLLIVGPTTRMIFTKIFPQQHLDHNDKKAATPIAQL